VQVQGMVQLKHLTEHVRPYLDVCDYFRLRYVTRLKFDMYVRAVCRVGFDVI
jgi:hypothetical protein